MWSCRRNKPRTISARSRMRCTAAGWLLWLGMSLAWSSCNGCTEPPLATLVNTRGLVDRDFAAEVHQWQPAKKGATFHINDGIRTHEESEAELWLRDGSGLRMLQKSFIRFSKTPPGEKRVGLKIEEGVILIEAATDNLKIDTRYGVAVIQKGTRIKLTRSKEGVELTVQIGRAQFIQGTAVTELVGGQKIHATVGAAVLVEDNDSAEEEQTAAPDSALPEPAEITDSQGEMSETPEESDEPTNTSHSARSPGEETTNVLSPDILLSPGETAWIHAVRSPVNIAIATSGVCPQGGTVKHGRTSHSFAAFQPAVFQAMAGTNRYAIRCAGDSPGKKQKAAATGRIQVIRDRGKVRLVDSPPISTVRMDGRTYNVNYQSRLPIVRVKWPTAPEGSRFTLRVTGNTPETLSLNAPQHTFAAGALKEGAHTLLFIEEGSGARSRSTTVKILFDNVSDKAILTEPAEGSFSSGATVSVRGTAMAEWQVSVPSGNVTMNGSGRFEGTVTHRREYRAIWLKLTHPARGVHYYIRRANKQ